MVPFAQALGRVQPDQPVGAEQPPAAWVLYRPEEADGIVQAIADQQRFGGEPRQGPPRPGSSR